MVFLRSKIVKNESYSYLVKSKWDSKRKTSQQETIKYLGKTTDVTLEDIPDEYRNEPNIVSFLSSNKNLENKVILITGAGDGMGKAAAIEYASQGASLILLGSRGLFVVIEEPAPLFSSFGATTKTSCSFTKRS